MSQFPIFFGMGALAAHTAEGEKGFRQKEVRFFAELFSNWIQLGGSGAIYNMHNTQILRFMNYLVSDAQAKRLPKKSQQTYRLTRAGLFTIVNKITSPSYLSARSECLLVWYFLKSYAGQIRENIAAAAQEFSRAHKLEMDLILDSNAFLRRQITFLDYEIARLLERRDGAYEMSKTVADMHKRGATLEQCVEAISEKYPYELNSQRTFRELLLKLPAPVISWELDQGAYLKARAVFAPLHRELTSHRQHLMELLEGT